VNLSVAYCTDIPSIVSNTAKTLQTTVPLSTLQNGVGFDPNSWAAIQVYIQELKAKAQKQCQ
jgi:hypothetical protein